MSRGITGTWAGTMPRPSGSPANAWKSSSRPSTPEQHKGLQTKGLEALWANPGPFPPSEGKEGDLCGIEGGTVVTQVEGVCL